MRSKIRGWRALESKKGLFIEKVKGEETSAHWEQQNINHASTIGCMVDVVAAQQFHKRSQDNTVYSDYSSWEREGLNALIGLRKDWVLSLYKLCSISFFRHVWSSSPLLISSRGMCVIARVYRMVAHEETFTTQEFLPVKSIRIKGLHYRKSS